MKKYFRFTTFTKDVIYFVSDKLGFGIVWRKNNPKKCRLGWVKFVWNEKYKCISSNVVYCGWNILKGYKALKAPWDPNENDK